MKKHFFYIIISLSTFCTFNLYAQPAKSATNNADTLKVFRKLPPLNDFIESALKNSPLLKVSDLQIEEMFEKIKKEKKSWSDFIFFDANAKYGLFNQLSIEQITGGADVSIKNAREQFNYYAGITFRLPISNFISKKNELNILDKNLNESKLRREQVKNELTQLVIDEYYKLINLSQSLQINQDALQSLEINYLKALKDVNSGAISLSEFNAALTAKQKTQDTYSKVENEYFAQFFKIQVLTGLKLNK